MCLTVDKEFKTRKEAREFKNKPLIAKKDIRVYKVLNTNCNTSMVRGMKYYKGFHHTELKPFNSKIYKVYWPDYWYIDINSGLHSYTNIKRANLMKCSGEKVVVMYIPKGSLFFKGDNEDYVSDQLVWY